MGRDEGEGCGSVKLFLSPSHLNPSPLSHHPTPTLPPSPALTPGWPGNHSPGKTAVFPDSPALSPPLLHLLPQSGLSLHRHRPVEAGIKEG